MARRIIAFSLALALAAPAFAQTRARNTSDWPCRAIKVPEISQAAVWSGPSLEGIPAAAWRDDAAIGALVARLSARRTPLEEADAAIRQLAASAGAARQEKLLALYAGLFASLAGERAQVLAGLERFGRRQKELADNIRAQTASMRELQDKPDADAAKMEEVTGKLAWDMRIFEDKRKSVAFVCETPVLIEQRLFALGRMVQAALE